jgi:hypothetical protein
MTIDRGSGHPDAFRQGAHAERLYAAIAAELACGGQDLILASDGSNGSG